jgi:hypothetical protein
MTAKQILVRNRVFLTEDVNQQFNLDVTGDCYIKTQKDIVKSMQEYAKEKCKELLEIVAKKARIIEDGDIDNPYEEYPLDLGGSVRVDKDSILNAIDLETFCS